MKLWFKIAVCKMRTEVLLDTRHCRKCAFTNVAYADPNMDSIFGCNNLRFSPEMFCHISVIKDDFCVVAYGCFYLPEHLQCEWTGQTECRCRKSITLFITDAETILVWMRSFADIFHISFSPLTNVSILMLNFTELMAADEYLNLILPKCTLVSVHQMHNINYVSSLHRSAHVWK